MIDNKPLHDYAETLGNAIRDGLKVEITPKFEFLFVQQARRLGPEWYEDLGSLALIECYESHEQGSNLDETEVRRILDRIRHRLVRSIQQQPMPWDSSHAKSRSSLTPESISSFVRQFIDMLSASEAAVFSLYMDGLSPDQIRRQLGISKATAYRILEGVRHRFTEFVQKLGLT